jgi:hypothetical protein
MPSRVAGTPSNASAGPILPQLKHWSDDRQRRFFGCGFFVNALAGVTRSQTRLLAATRVTFVR